MECTPEQLFRIYPSSELILISQDRNHTQLWIPEDLREARAIVQQLLDQLDWTDLKENSRVIQTYGLKITSNQDLPPDFLDRRVWDYSPFRSQVDLSQLNLSPGELLIFAEFESSSRFILGSHYQIADYLCQDCQHQLHRDQILGNRGQYLFPDPESALEVWKIFQQLRNPK